MDNTTRKALLASIKHWEENRDAATKDSIRIYHDHCPLCTLFVLKRAPTVNDNCAYNCYGCPVAEKTGLPLCVDTPWIEAKDEYVFMSGKPQQTWQEAAQAEIDFLKSLLD